MHACRPDWRWEEILIAIEKGIPPTDTFLKEVYNVKTGASEQGVITYALQMYAIHEYRDTIIAFFLSGATLDQINQGTAIVPEVLKVFEQLFMDPVAFRNKLEWRSYVDYYVQECCYNENGKTQVLKGVTEGPLSLLQRWRKGGERLLPSNHELATEYLLIAFEKAILARNSSIMSDAAREAYKWGVLGLKALSTRESMRDIGQGEIGAVAAIKKRKATLEAQELGIKPGDIVH